MKFLHSRTLIACSVVFSFFLPTVGEARTLTFACGGQKLLTSAIRSLAPGDVLLVSGTCNENVVIPEEVARVTIDGQGSATIHGVSASQHSVIIQGSGITITRFTVSGGLDGINVNRNGAATISGNTIEAVGRDGISVSQSATARITNNAVQNNPRVGILVTESASVRVGLLNFEGLETIPGGTGPNQIVGNAEDGIRILRSSSGVVLGNNISGNGRDGVLVYRASFSDISGNAIDGNGRHGINVGESSAVRLGEDSGSELDELPNTTSANNGGFGIFCGLNSTLNGRLGTLNGANGSSSSAGCTDSLQ